MGIDVIARQTIGWALLLGPSIGILAVATRLGQRSEVFLPVCWALGPWIWIGATGLLRLAGVELLPSSLGALLPFVVMILACLRKRTIEAMARGFPGKGMGWAMAASVMLLAAFFLLRDGETALWDSEFHARIATYLQASALPPDNPFLAGRPLVYPWFFNLEVAAIAVITGLTPYRVFAILDLHAILSLVLALSLCIPASMRAARGGALAVFLGIWAPNSLGWLFHAVRWTTGEVTGLSAIRQAASNFDQVLSQMAPWFTRCLAFPAHKFFEGTAYAEALACPFLAIFLAGRIVGTSGALDRSTPHEAHQRSSSNREGPLEHSASLQLPWIEVTLLALVIAVWCHVHFMSAFLFFPPMLAMGLIAAMTDRPHGTRRSRHLILLTASIALGVILSLPYLLGTFGSIIHIGGSRLLGLGPRLDNLLALPAVVLPYALIAVLGRRMGTGRSRDRPESDSSATALPSGWAAGYCALILIWGTALALTDHNEDKILIPGVMLVPVIAWPLMGRALSARTPRLVRGGVALFFGATVAGALMVVALASGWNPPAQYQWDRDVSEAVERLAPRGAVIVSDSFAPLPQRRSGYLYFPELQGMWGFVADLQDREGVMASLKGAPVRHPLGLPAVRECVWPERTQYTPEGAVARLRELDGGAVIIAPAGSWGPISGKRATLLGLRTLPPVAGWDLFLVPPRASDEAHSEHLSGIPEVTGEVRLPVSDAPQGWSFVSPL
jgi:hypothetical protein